MDKVSLNNIRRITRSRPKPADFTLITVEANDGAIWLCVYENEIMSYENSIRESIFIWLQGIQSEIAKSGLRVELIGRPGDPPANSKSR
jgi:hypothetical protein